MKKIEFRTLTADEVECRVGTVTDSGCSLLIYKDARVDMRLLDEVVGATNWKREHEVINGNLFCTVSIWDSSKNEWVSKQDVGVESNTEKEKGQASDAFKRACFNWGIGRELYTCPFVWIKLGANEWRPQTNGRKQPKTRFAVADIQYVDNKVSYLRIVDENGTERFVYESKELLMEALGDAIAEAKSAEDMTKLEHIYHKYQERFGKDKAVLAAVTERKNVLTNKAA